MNNRNIPKWLEDIVINRDTKCIYCWIIFDKNIKKLYPTWEHIINDQTIISENNIALCCCSCNASKWSKKLSVWLNSLYCKNKNISINTISDIAKNSLINN